ncbi:MAG TPA: hypothetical protein VG897_11335 [Terriglobales bacterium]|nr:hypothetical protein [Terriglobales bacterium]
MAADETIESKRNIRNSAFSFAPSPYACQCFRELRGNRAVRRSGKGGSIVDDIDSTPPNRVGRRQTGGGPELVIQFSKIRVLFGVANAGSTFDGFAAFVGGFVA